MPPAAAQAPQLATIIAAWEAADLALRLPAWADTPQAFNADGTNTLRIARPDGAEIRLRLLDAALPDEGAARMLAEALAAVDLLPLNYAPISWLGRSALTASARSAEGAWVGSGRIGRLPDRRFVALVGRVPASEGELNDGWLRLAANSLIFTANGTPPLPAYRLIRQDDPTRIPFDTAVLTPTPSPFEYDLREQAGRYVINRRSADTSFDFPLNANAAAPPLYAPVGRRLFLLEWLASLLDDGVAGFVSVLTGTEITPLGWIEDVEPAQVLAFTCAEDGRCALGLTDGAAVYDSTGQSLGGASLASPVIRLAFRADGSLIASMADGSMAELSDQEPNRQGETLLRPDVPVLGVVTEAQPAQSWWYDGKAGEVITISAVDQARSSPFEIGLDIEIVLTAPDGTELARNDDHGGQDLFNAFDAQIADLALPADGRYTVTVNWVQGRGMYTLGVTADRRLNFDERQIAQARGRLQDVFPVERWTFSAEAGEVITVTLTGDSTLDPALEVLLPNGATLRYIDDALDTELGVAAQLARLTLPETGLYVIEASRTAFLDPLRVNGSGAYTLIVVRH